MTAGPAKDDNHEMQAVRSRVERTRTEQHKHDTQRTYVVWILLHRASMYP